MLKHRLNSQLKNGGCDNALLTISQDFMFWLQALLILPAGGSANSSLSVVVLMKHTYFDTAVNFGFLDRSRYFPFK
jgi:hypothetical protein